MENKVYSFEPVWPRDEEHQLMLDGDWEVAVADRPWLDEPCGLHRASWFRVDLPDGLQDALFRAGVIPNPWQGQNWRQTEWVFRTDWWFRKVFTLPEGWRGKRIRLTFEGLDYYGRVWLNGHYLGFHEGAYGGPTFDVGNHLHFGEPNELVIRAGQSRDEREMSPMVKPTALRRGAISWGNKNASVGIYAPVRLVVTEDSFLECPFIQTESLIEDKAKLWVQCHLHNLGREYYGTIELLIRQWPDGQSTLETSFQQRVPEGASMLEREVELPYPRLWWPNGLGAQPLYSGQFILRHEDGRVEDQICLRFGVRMLELVRNPIDPEKPRLINSPTTFEKDAMPESPMWRGFADGEKIAPSSEGLMNSYMKSLTSDMADSQGDANYRFFFRINGKEFYAGGASWLPVTDTMSNLPERYRWLLHLAKEGNLRLLRLNGGTTPFERECFYELCDEMGILVWQESMAGSPAPYDKPLDVWREQLTQNVYRLRTHPCLALWVFGNELDPYEDKLLALAGLTREVCMQLDPSRAFRPSSPGGGTRHAYGPAGLMQAEEPWYLQYYGKDVPFISEWSALAMLSESSYRRVVRDEEFDDLPVGYDWEEFFNHHPDIFDHWAESYSLGPQTALLKATAYGDFGEANLSRVIEYTQMGQAITYGYVTENWRAMFPYHDGETVWTFNALSPCSSWHTVDWFGGPNIAYYFRKRAYQPLHVLACLPCFSWYINETFSARLMAIGETKKPGLTMVARILDPQLNDIQVSEFTTNLPGDGRPSIPEEIQFKIPMEWLDAYFFLELSLVDRNSNVLSRNLYWLRVTSYLADESFRKRYRTSVHPMPIWKQGPWLEPQIAACPTGLRTELIADISLDSCGIAHTSVMIDNLGDKPVFPLRITTADPYVCLMCSDNYFWLRAGEQRQIEISLLLNSAKINPCFPVSPSQQVALSVSSWNAAEQVIQIDLPKL